MRKRGYLTILPNHRDWPERAILLLTFYRRLFRGFLGKALALLVGAVLGLCGIMLAARTEFNGYPAQERPAFWTASIIFGISVILLTIHITLKRPIVEGWAKGYWHLWIEAWGSKRAILWDSLAIGTTCWTFSLNEPVLRAASEEISPHFQNLDGESKFTERSGTLLTRLLETTFSKHCLPIADADWTRIDSTQPLMQALACCSPLPQGAARMTEFLALPSPLLSRTDTASLIACLNTFMCNASHTRDSLNTLRDGVQHKRDLAQKSLQERISNTESAPFSDPSDWLEPSSSSADALENSVKAGWKLSIQAIEEEIKPDLERLEHRTLIHTSQIDTEAMIATSQQARQLESRMESLERERSDLERELLAEHDQIQVLDEKTDFIQERVKELAKAKSDKLRQVRIYASKVARLSGQEEISSKLRRLELEQQRLEYLRSVEQSETQYHQYKMELDELASDYRLAVRKHARLMHSIQEVDSGREGILSQWRAQTEEWKTRFSERKERILDSERKEKDYIRREVTELREDRDDILNAIKASGKKVNPGTGKISQALVGFYKKVEDRLIECRKLALQVVSDEILETIEQIETPFAQTCSIIERAKRPARPLRVKTGYCLPVWVIAYQENVSSPVLFHYTTLTQIKQVHRFPFGEEIEMDPGPWADLQKEADKRLNKLEKGMAYFIRENPVTRLSCWCILRELDRLTAKGVSRFWLHFLGVALTMRIIKGQPWREQIIAIKNILRGRYDLITVPQVQEQANSA